MTRFDPGLHLPPDNVARDLSIPRNPFFFRAPTPSPSYRLIFFLLLLPSPPALTLLARWNYRCFFSVKSFPGPSRRSLIFTCSWSCVFWIIRKYYWRVIFLFFFMYFTVFYKCNFGREYIVWIWNPYIWFLYNNF